MSLFRDSNFISTHRREDFYRNQRNNAQIRPHSAERSLKSHLIYLTILLYREKNRNVRMLYLDHGKSTEASEKRKKKQKDKKDMEKDENENTFNRLRYYAKAISRAPSSYWFNSRAISGCADAECSKIRGFISSLSLSSSCSSRPSFSSSLPEDKAYARLNQYGRWAFVIRYKISDRI